MDETLAIALDEIKEVAPAVLSEDLIAREEHHVNGNEGETVNTAVLLPDKDVPDVGSEREPKFMMNMRTMDAQIDEWLRGDGWPDLHAHTPLMATAAEALSSWGLPSEGGSAPPTIALAEPKDVSSN